MVWAVLLRGHRESVIAMCEARSKYLPAQCTSLRIAQHDHTVPLVANVVRPRWCTVKIRYCVGSVKDVTSGSGDNCGPDNFGDGSSMSHLSISFFSPLPSYNAWFWTTDMQQLSYLLSETKPTLLASNLLKATSALKRVKRRKHQTPSFSCKHFA